jgi:hypothetical protein
MIITEFKTESQNSQTTTERERIKRSRKEVCIDYTVFVKTDAEKNILKDAKKDYKKTLAKQRGY